jgi:hypothetical protein
MDMKIQIFTLCLLFSVLIGNAKTIQGYYIDLTGEKHEVDFKIKTSFIDGSPQIIKLQESVKYVVNGEEFILTPDRCKSFVFNINDKEYVMEAIENTSYEPFKSKKNYIFLNAIISNQPINVYFFYRKSNKTYMQGDTRMGESGVSFDIYYYKRSTMEFYRARGNEKIDFLAEYFKDCEMVVQKILDKEINRKHFYTMVMEYNKCMLD